MWIKTKDDKHLVDIIKFSVRKSLLSKQRGILYGHYAATFFRARTIKIGKYKTVDEALMALREIETALMERPSSIYYVQ